MSRLDSAAELDRVDPSGALGLIASLGSQVAGAIGVADELAVPDPAGVESVVCCGMGGSAIGGDVAAMLGSGAGTVPVVVHRGYGLPAFVGPRTFVVASSYSGGTEETIDAFRCARAAGARGLAVACGGPLASEASEAGWVVGRPEAGMLPRFAIGWMTALPLAVLERMGLLRPGAGWRERVPAALHRWSATWGPAAPLEDNPAKALAHELAGRIPVVWGGDGASAVAAVRWRNDFNENAKVPAHAAALPEADHNEIVGWAAEGRQGRPAGTHALVCLRESVEDPRIAARFEATIAEVSADFDRVLQVTGTGADPLERFFTLAMLGGFVSAYVAILRGVDPVPIESIARLKAALAGG